jgi:hypothetical protein
MKEMTSVASAMMTDEEKEELEREINKQMPTVTPAGEQPFYSSCHCQTPVQLLVNPPTEPGSRHTGSGIWSCTRIQWCTNNTNASLSASIRSIPTSTCRRAHTVPSQSGASTPKPATEGRKGKSKLTPEQKQKIDEIAAERDEAMVKRVAELTDKLKRATTAVCGSA